MIIEDRCYNYADVVDWIGDYDYEIVKLKYTNEVENV